MTSEEVRVALIEARHDLVSAERRLRDLERQLFPHRESYPYEEGDVIVLGPECFVSKDGTVICLRGENYYSWGRLAAIAGWVSAELASRADAWNGNAPPWFPEPPEWLDLFQRALDATGDGDG